MRKIDTTDPRQKARFERCIEEAISEGDGEPEWEDVMDVMNRALALYDDPAFEPEERVQ